MQLNDLYVSVAQELQTALNTQFTKIAQYHQTLEAENQMLRHLMALSINDCIYCGRPKDSMSLCDKGFPGCPRAKDSGSISTPASSSIPT